MGAGTSQLSQMRTSSTLGLEADWTSLMIRVSDSYDPPASEAVGHRMGKEACSAERTALRGRSVGCR